MQISQIHIFLIFVNVNSRQTEIKTFFEHSLFPKSLHGYHKVA